MIVRIGEDALAVIPDGENPTPNNIRIFIALDSIGKTKDYENLKLNDGNGIPPKPKDLGILPTIILTKSKQEVTK